MIMPSLLDAQLDLMPNWIQCPTEPDAQLDFGRLTATGSPTGTQNSGRPDRFREPPVLIRPLQRQCAFAHLLLYRKNPLTGSTSLFIVCISGIYTVYSYSPQAGSASPPWHRAGRCNVPEPSGTPNGSPFASKTSRQKTHESYCILEGRHRKPHIPKESFWTLSFPTQATSPFTSKLSCK